MSADNIMELSSTELKRYARHLVLPEVGVEGQKKLKAASVLIVGAGGLGSPVALYLAAAGVGRIGLVDFDVVDESNLQRQIIYGQSDIGCLKAESARDAMIGINPYVVVQLHHERLEVVNKLITGSGETMLGRLAVYDALEVSYRFIPLRRAPVRAAVMH